MSDNVNQEEQKSTVIVDGSVVSIEEFSQIREEINRDSTRRLKEVSPGIYRIIMRLNENAVAG